MKKHIKHTLLIGSILLLSIVLLSCKEIKDKINEATTTTITTDIVIPIDPLKHVTLSYKIDIPFSDSAIYQITTNEEIKKNLNKITKVKALSIEMKVIAADPSNLNLKTANILIKEPTNTDYFTFAMPANFPLQTDNSYKVTENDTDFSTLNTALNKLGEIQLIAMGALTYPLNKAELELAFIIQVEATVGGNI